MLKTEELQLVSEWDKNRKGAEVEHVITICIWTVRGRKVLLFI